MIRVGFQATRAVPLATRAHAAGPVPEPGPRLLLGPRASSMPIRKDQPNARLPRTVTRPAPHCGGAAARRARRVWPGLHSGARRLGGARAVWTPGGRPAGAREACDILVAVVRRWAHVGGPTQAQHRGRADSDTGRRGAQRLGCEQHACHQPPRCRHPPVQGLARAAERRSIPSHYYYPTTVVANFQSHPPRKARHQKRMGTSQ